MSSVKFIVGKNTLMEIEAVEFHSQRWVEVKTDDRRVRLNTTLSIHDGHSRLLVGGRKATGNNAKSLISKQCDVPGCELVRKIHARTCFHPDTVKVLFKRSGRWDTDAEKELKELLHMP